MFGDRLAADAFDKIEREAEPDRAGDVRGPGLEAVRRVLKLGLRIFHARDHAAAGLPGRHRLQRVIAAVQDTGAGRP